MTSLTYGSRPRPERAIAFATIAGLHALVIGLILSGLGRTAVQMIEHEMEVTPLPEAKKQVPPLPSPEAPTLERSVVDLGPPPDFDLTIPGDGDGTALTGPISETPPQQPPVAQATPLPIRLVGRNRLPNTDEYYPAQKIRDGIEGASVVKVCVDENGKRTGEPTVQQSSGDAGLDLGAQHVARDGRYARAMQGDKYVPNCYAFKIIFQVRKN